MEKKPFKQELSSLKTRVIDEIRNNIGKGVVFIVNNPMYTINGDNIEIRHIVNVDGDIFVHGTNTELEFDDEVEQHISEIELSELIDIYESIDDLYNPK